MLILTDGKSSLEVNLVSWDGDAYISVKLDSRGYSAQADHHVFSEVFKKFCSDMVELQKCLKGKAVLKAVSSEELNIEIRPVGNLGHMAVYGKCGCYIQTAQHMNWHSTELGFEFEPQQLDKAINVGWIKEYSI